MSGEPEPQIQDGSEPIRELAELFDDATMKSSVRLLIVISLSINRRMVFTDLLKLTGTGKGSLSNHLERLSAGGYIRLRVIPTLSGPRTIAEITQKGLELYRKYLEIMEKIRGSTESSSSSELPQPEGGDHPLHHPTIPSIKEPGKPPSHTQE